MTRSLVMLLTSIILGVGGQLAIKMGITRTGDLQVLLGQSVWRFAGAVIGSPLIVTGIVLYAVSMIFWLLVLSRIDLSLAYPMLALSYVGVMLVSLFVLGEKVTAIRWIGAAFIILGVILTASTAKV